jgi:hypothetical protein
MGAMRGIGAPFFFEVGREVRPPARYYLNALGFELRWRANEGFACVARDQGSIFPTNDNQNQPRNVGMSASIEENKFQ